MTDKWRDLKVEGHCLACSVCVLVLCCIGGGAGGELLLVVARNNIDGQT